MIRFRIGQSWKRDEPGREPTDAFAFELEGVNLLPGANDEPLVRVISGLVDAVAALVVDGDRAGQLSLEDVQLEACFWRRAGHTVEVAIIALGGEPRRVRPVVTVELPALVEATLSVARSFLRDSEAHREAHAAALVALERRVKVLGSTVIRELHPPDEAPWHAERTDGVGYVLHDAEGRSSSFHRRARAGLPSLLIDGRVTFRDQAIDGLPFLTIMGLARAAAGGPVKVGTLKVMPEAVFGAGLDLCLALRARNPMLATNPWLEALQVRCADGLRAMRKPVPDISGATISVPRPAVPTGAPLSTEGQVRRVGLALAWSRPVALGEDGGRLRVARGGVVAQSAHAAHGFTSRGTEAFRRLSTHGVAANLDGSLVASAERVLHFGPKGASATWLRDHDGSALGPGLETLGELVLTSLARRGVVAFERLTGRERWRFDPPRTQRSWSSLIGSRVLVATDSGTLFGVDLSSGQLVFTVRSQVPCAGPAIACGRRALVVLNRGEHTPVYLCDAQASGERAAGAVVWTRELTLGAPRPAAVTRTRIFLAGVREGRATVIALSSSGQVLWERAVHLEAASVTLVAFKGGVIAGDARGTAVRLMPDGQSAWVLGGEGDQLGAAIPLAISRSVLVVPGPVLRLVDPVTGRELFALPPAPRVTDVAVDSRLNVYVLKEPGLLEAWKPAAVLSIV